MFTLLAAVAMQAAAPAPAPDYAQDASWLCRPGRKDACAVDQDVTVIAADGTRKLERFKPAAAPKFDCFYVYPTLSHDPGPNSDMIPGPEERLVVAAQAARFAAQCRVFAPMYRQVTLTALRASMLSGAPITGRELAYADVRAAWASYLARDNRGRGVVLIGHSQGSGILKQLIAQEIEGKPAASRMIAAYLAGTNVVDGDLKSTPACTSANQSGCVVAWVSFRADSPPPANSRFGTLDGKPALCVNAAQLNGSTTMSKAIFTTAGAGESSKPMGPWTKDGAAVTTPFVSVPGLISTKCSGDGTRNWLAVTVNADPADPRTDTIVGDVTVGTVTLKDWGLHLIDMPVVMGDLVELSGKQAAAWAAKK